MTVGSLFEFAFWLASVGLRIRVEFQGLRQQVAHSLYLSPEVALYLFGIYALTGVCPMYRHHGHSLDAFEERHVFHLFDLFRVVC